MKKSKLLSIYMIVIIMLFILTFSISLPILIRPFYYAHIKLLKLPEITGWSYQEIKIAYNSMLNYCLGLTNTFSTGILKFSQEGMNHFTDCRTLFILDLSILIFTALNIIFMPSIKKRFKLEYYNFRNRSIYYNAASILIISFTLIGVFAATNFDKAFVIFHQIFFPGKDNWLFDPYKDEIINVLPEVFFANCGLFIVLTLILFCLYIIINENKKAVN